MMDYLFNRSYIVGIVSEIVLLMFLFKSCLGSKTPAFFVFGDSLVDAGNNNYLASLSKANLFPYGIDFGEPTGRFTNGRTIVDIIGQELGFDGFIPPYLAPTTTGSAVLNGVNYASGGGGILNETGNVFGGRINLDAQIDNFENTKQDIMSNVGVPATTRLIQSSIFSITIGSNDFINNYLTPVLSAVEQNLESPEVFVARMVSRLRQQLIRLYGLGARKMAVVNVGPIGCIPYERDLHPDAGENCVGSVNQLAQMFNSELNSLVDELRGSMGGSVVVYGQVYHIVDDILKNYKSYGFDNADFACCHVEGRYGGLVPCGPSSRVCVDRSKYVFWDPFHPSDAANLIIAKRLMDGGSADIFPINIRHLAQL